MEYALIGGLIAVVIVAAVSLVGTNLNGLYDKVQSSVGSAIS